jgi:hypothetical protein
MIYHRIALGGRNIGAVEDHVRRNLAAAVDFDDDPDVEYDAVRITFDTLVGGDVKVTGELDAEPAAPYLQPGYDPDDLAANPPRYSLDGPLDDPSIPPTYQHP